MFHLDFEISHFPIKFLAKKGCFLGLERVKRNFTTFGPLENFFWLLLEKKLPTPTYWFT